MPAQGDALPAAAPSGTLDQAAKWFWSFLKNELSPYPGRSWVVGRITIAATIVMLLVMTFRLPGGFLAAIFTLFLSRENPTATLLAGIRTTIAFAFATLYTLLGIMLLVDDPLTHFLWIMLTLFLAFYIISIVPDYGTAVGFGFLTSGAIPLWDVTTVSVNTRVENTLWVLFSVLVGSAVTIAVEYVFRRVHPTTDLTQGIETRLHAVEYVLRNVAAEISVDPALEKQIALFSNVGASRLRRFLARSGYSAHFIAQMNAAVAILGRLVDLAASLRILQATAGPEDRERCLHLADRLADLRRHLLKNELPHGFPLSASPQPSKLPFLAEMERMIALLPQAFSGSETISDFFVPAPMDEDAGQRLIAADAFTNPAHLHFALRGMSAAMVCYVAYTLFNWPGLSTSVVTCIITALSTIGASRQKQFLRLMGAIIGGIVIGMGAQLFVLPYLDSIAGFTLLFAIVTAIAAWIGTASPKLSYLGVQLALAFYIINLQEFAIQTSLAVARDRVFGVLLGLLSMWLVFDRLGVKNAIDEMQFRFARNLQMFAELADQLLNPDRNAAVKRIRQLRDQLNAGFDAVRAQADAVLFEFGPDRQRKLKIRDDIRRWQPLLRTLLQVEITFGQYLLQKPLEDLPADIAAANTVFASDIAAMARALAEEVRGERTQPVPDVSASAGNLQREIRAHFDERGLPLPPDVSDIISITQSLASITEQLHGEMHIGIH